MPELVDSARSGAFCSSLPTIGKNTLNDGLLGVFQDGNRKELVHSAPLWDPLEILLEAGSPAPSL
jgi:hypothetical protein